MRHPAMCNTERTNVRRSHQYKVERAIQRTAEAHSRVAAFPNTPDVQRSGSVSKPPRRKSSPQEGISKKHLLRALVCVSPAQALRHNRVEGHVHVYDPHRLMVRDPAFGVRHSGSGYTRSIHVEAQAQHSSVAPGICNGMGRRERFLSPLRTSVFRSVVRSRGSCAYGGNVPRSKFSLIVSAADVCWLRRGPGHSGVSADGPPCAAGVWTYMKRYNMPTWNVKIPHVRQVETSW